MIAICIAEDIDGADLVVTASQDQKVLVFNVETEQKVRQSLSCFVTAHGQVTEFVGHGGSVVSISLSPDKHSVFSGSLDGCVCHWDLVSGDMIRKYDIQSKGVLALEATAQHFFTGSRDNSAACWEIATGEMTHRQLGLAVFANCGSDTKVTSNGSSV